MSRRATNPTVAVTEVATRLPVTVPNLAGLRLGAPAARRGAPTGEFYALPSDEAREAGRDTLTLEPVPAGAERNADDATFRLPFPESAPKKADGSYQYRVYDAAALWEWVRAPGKEFDPLDRTPLLRRDWEELRDRYSNAAAHPTPDPTPDLMAFRAPITTGLWPPGVPYPPYPLPTDATIRDAVKEALTAGGPEYVHPHYGPIAGWDVSRVTNMSFAFRGAAAFNGDLSRWQVGAVTNMNSMFHGAKAFNGDLSRWDVRNVTRMRDMFSFAAAFNGDLSRWDVGAVTDMYAMFQRATAFNGDLSRWDVRAVTDMDLMFAGAAAFNGDLSGWDVGAVTNMSAMFAGTAAFNRDLIRWDVRAVKDMEAMFQDASAFNGDLSRWDVRAVTNMEAMFEGADAYRPEREPGSRPAWFYVGVGGDS